MRRHELEARAGRGETGPTPPDPRTVAFDADASAPSLAKHNPGQLDPSPRADDRAAQGGSNAAPGAAEAGAAPHLSQV
ncbi:MAG: hypothetical protein ACREDI_11550, partial [Roseiarcus sp.]